MGDVLLLVGLGLLVTAGFLVSAVAGFIVAGAACLLLSLALSDLKLGPLLSKLAKVRPWRRS